MSPQLKLTKNQCEPKPKKLYPSKTCASWRTLQIWAEVSSRQHKYHKLIESELDVLDFNKRVCSHKFITSVKILYLYELLHKPARDIKDKESVAIARLDALREILIILNQIKFATDKIFRSPL